MTSQIGSSGRRTMTLERPDRDAHCRSLEHRLDDGYQRIDEASLTGLDVTEWESFWIRLLGEYEGVCRELEEAA